MLFLIFSPEIVYRLPLHLDKTSEVKLFKGCISLILFISEKLWGAIHDNITSLYQLHTDNFKINCFYTLYLILFDFDTLACTIISCLIAKAIIIKHDWKVWKEFYRQTHMNFYIYLLWGSFLMHIWYGKEEYILWWTIFCWAVWFMIIIIYSLVLSYFNTVTFCFNTVT